MFLTTANHRDIDRYFRACFVKFPDLHGDKLFFIQRVHEDRIVGDHIDDEGEEAPFTYYLPGAGGQGERDLNAEFLLPIKSFFNHEGSAMLLARKPLRQYKKGICDENTAVYQLTPGGYVERGICWDVLNAYVGKQQFLPFHQPEKNEGSYAVSSRMAVSSSGTIYIDRSRIASIDFVKNVIETKNNLFVDEITTVLKNHMQHNIYQINPAPAARPAKSAAYRVTKSTYTTAQW